MYNAVSPKRLELECWKFQDILLDQLGLDWDIQTFVRLENKAINST